MAALRIGSDVVRQESPSIMVGVDIGQRVDPSTIVVAEALKTPRPGMKPEHRFEIRHMERLPIGTSYPDVAQRVAGIVGTIEQRPLSANWSTPRIWLLADATGVGRPVVDILKEALHTSRVRIRAVTFVAGDQVTGDLRGRNYAEIRMGKAFLVSRLQALFQTERVKLPANHAEATAMVDELMNYEIRVSEDASDKMGVFKTGKHDDLVTALGLAVLMDPPGAGLWAT